MTYISLSRPNEMKRSKIDEASMKNAHFRSRDLYVSSRISGLSTAGIAAWTAETKRLDIALDFILSGRGILQKQAFQRRRTYPTCVKEPGISKSRVLSRIEIKGNPARKITSKIVLSYLDCTTLHRISSFSKFSVSMNQRDTLRSWKCQGILAARPFVSVAIGLIGADRWQASQNLSSPQTT